MSRLIERARGNLERRGVVGTLRRIGFLATRAILRPLGQWNHDLVLMYEKHLTPENVARPEGLELVVATVDDIDEFYDNRWHSREEARALVEKGAWIFLLKDGPKNAYYSMVEFGSTHIPFLGVDRLDFADDVGYFSCVLVHPDYRGQNLAARGLRYVEWYLLEHQRVDRLFAITAPHKVPANRAFQKSPGFRAYQLVNAFHSFGLRIYDVNAYQDDQPDGRRKVVLGGTSWWNWASSILR